MNRKNVNAAMRTAKRFWMTLLVLGFIAIGFVQAAELAFAQATVTARFRNVTLDEVLWEMQKQTNLTFIYSTEEAKQVRIKDMDVNNEKVSVVLDRCLRNSGLMYTVHNGAVVIKPNHDTVGQAAATQQKVELKGVVTDAELNEPVIGANVVVMGTGKGTVTDLDGRFVLQVDKLPVTLSVSFVGYQREEVKVSTGQMLKIVLKPDYNLTDEVVVTGYGTFKKSAYAGSASTLKTDNIKDVPTVSFMDMLQGNAPGVQFSSPSGQPGAAASINIRGMGSFNASNSPLYVIDGVPVISGSINSISSDAGLDIMSTINSSDIENITIIKDAAAASLYGSRAANGVVLITTKTGKVGKPVISFKADWGMSDFAMDYRPVMNGAQRREYIYNGLKAGALRDGDTEEEAIAYADAEIDDYAPIPWCGYVNWDDVMFKKGSHQTYEASI